MADNNIDIWVYADWLGMTAPKCIGLLSVLYGRGKEAFSFKYENDWLNSNEQLLLDPDIGWYSGSQYPDRKDNFGIFLDSMPDTWGRTLMKRREAQLAREKNLKVKTLHDIDYLLGVYDKSRMGALRYKLNSEGPFLDDTGHQWIAKFPSNNDTIDKGAWEYLAYVLAIEAGIKMTESKIEKVSGKYHTFFTKRFDRLGEGRIHFASAMTGNNDSAIKDITPSYLEIVEFIQNYGSEIKADLHQLWKRLVFNIAISNTDDHLRNHGFIISNNGWRLSPAFDINPSIDKDGLALNIDMTDNSLDFELAKSVGDYFQIKTFDHGQ